MTVDTAATPDAAPDAGDDTAPDAATPRHRRRTVLPWVLVVLALGAALYSTAQWRSLATVERDRGAVTDVAREVLLGMTNWDATRDLAETRQHLRDLGTAAFPQDVDGFLGGPVADSLRAIEATSVGVVEDLFVQSLEGDDATAFAVVRQTLDTTLLVNPSEGFQYARVFLQRVDGAWKVAAVELLGGDEPSIDPLDEPQPDDAAEDAAPEQEDDR